MTVDTPKADFVRAMQDAVDRFVAATTRREKLDIEKEMAAIVKANRGCDTDDVPRATTRDRACHKRRARVGRGSRRRVFPEGYDWKRMQAGDGNEDE
jgi:hypothetical protein